MKAKRRLGGWWVTRPMCRTCPSCLTYLVPIPLRRIAVERTSLHWTGEICVRVHIHYIKVASLATGLGVGGCLARSGINASAAQSTRMEKGGAPG